MVFSEFRRRFDVLAPHLTKKHGRNYIVVDERRVGLGPRALPDPFLLLRPLRAAAPCPLERARALAPAPGFGCPGPARACGSPGEKATWRSLGEIRKDPPTLEARLALW